MQVYCAETGDLKQYIFTRKPKDLPKFNILFSFYYTQTIEPYLPYAKSIIVDSGGYTFQTSKSVKITPDEYFRKYKAFTEKIHKLPCVDGIFELDIDNLVGYDQVKEYREKLFDITDKIIPVWHKTLGLQEYKNMCKEFDFIAIPCTQDRNVKPKAYGKFVKYAHKYNCRVHGLGMLRPKVLNKVPFDTVDGTGWFKANRFGKLYGKKVNSEYLRGNRSKLIYIELINHIKFQEEMHKKWQRYHND